MNKTTRTLSEEEIRLIMRTITEGFSHNGRRHRGNIQICFALYLESQTGCRIGDIVQLTLQSFQKVGNETHIVITEQKTGKKRDFFISEEVYSSILDYCLSNNKKKDDRIITIGVRQIQKILKDCCEYLELDSIGSHSFRKTLATNLYDINHNLILVQRFLQHSSPQTTFRYIGLDKQEVKEAMLTTSRPFTY